MTTKRFRKKPIEIESIELIHMYLQEDERIQHLFSGKRGIILDSSHIQKNPFLN